MNFLFDDKTPLKQYSNYASEVSHDIENLFVKDGSPVDRDAVEIAKTLYSSKHTTEDKENMHYYNGPDDGEIVDFDTPAVSYVYQGPINAQDYLPSKSTKQREQTTQLLMMNDLNEQFPDKSKMYIQLDSTNPSAVNLAKLLFNLGVKRWYTPLMLADKTLDGVDPYNPNLDDETRRRITIECRTNLIYYAREVAKVSVPGTTEGTKMFFHIGSFTCIYLTANNINYYIEQPRQTFKSGTDNVIKGWMWNMSCRNADIGLFANTNDKAKDNLKKTMETLELLPSYLQFFKFKMSESNGTEEIALNNHYSKTEKAVHGLYNNTIFATTTGQTKDNASKTGRGKTLVSFNFDEFGFSKFNWLAYTAAVPTFGQASGYARKQGMPSNFTMTSTPPDATTKEGEWLWKLLNKAPKFSLKIFDMSGAEIREYMKVSGEVNLLFCSFAYNELGFTQEWLEERLRDLGDRHAFDVEIMLKWKRILTHSPFSRRALDLISVNAKNSLRRELWLDGIYKFHTYANFERCRSTKVVIGVDIGSGSGTGDYSTMVGVDPRTTEILFTFKANQHDTEIFSRIIAKFVREYCPRAVIVVERNGIGEGVVSKLKHLDDLVDNLYYQSASDSNTSFDVSGSNDYKEPLYGLHMNGPIRSVMYTEILTTRVNRYKRLFNSEEIADELMSVTIGKNGRYDHLPGQHDDLLMAYMMALYVLYKDINLDAKFGLNVPAVLDDEAMDYSNLQNFIKKDDLEEKMSEEDKLRRAILEDALRGNENKGYLTPEDLFFKRDFETAQFYQKQYGLTDPTKIPDNDDEMVEAGMSFGNNKRTNRFRKIDRPF